MRERLSPVQKRVLRIIQSRIDEQGFPPTVREIQDSAGFKSMASVHNALYGLRRRGVIAVSPHISRGIRILRHVDSPRRMTADEQMLNDRIAALDSPTLVIYADRTKSGEYVGFTAYDAGAKIVREKLAEDC